MDRTGRQGTGCDGGGAGVEDDGDPAGRAAVRALLIGPLLAQGLQRRRGVTVEAHEAMLRRLTEALDYAAPDVLRALVPVLIAQAGGGGRYWPEEVEIKHWAWRLQPPPSDRTHYVRSLLVSAMGDRAAQEGWLVPLYLTARRLGPPPGRYVISRLRAQADEDARRVRVVREKVAGGVADADEVAWLKAHARAAAEAAALRQGLAS